MNYQIEEYFYQQYIPHRFVNRLLQSSIYIYSQLVSQLKHCFATHQQNLFIVYCFIVYKITKTHNSSSSGQTEQKNVIPMIKIGMEKEELLYKFKVYRKKLFLNGSTKQSFAKSKKRFVFVICYLQYLSGYYFPKRLHLGT